MLIGLVITEIVQCQNVWVPVFESIVMGVSPEAKNKVFNAILRSVKPLSLEEIVERTGVSLEVTGAALEILETQRGILPAQLGDDPTKKYKFTRSEEPEQTEPKFDPEALAQVRSFIIRSTRHNTLEDISKGTTLGPEEVALCLNQLENEGLVVPANLEPDLTVRYVFVPRFPSDPS